METFLTKSPHAVDPTKRIDFSEEEKAQLRGLRVNEFKPYTVIDVITKVFHRNFTTDFTAFIVNHQEQFRPNHVYPDWKLSNVWIKKCKVVRPESVFDQPTNRFYVDILMDTKFKLHIVKPGCEVLNTDILIEHQYRLRYRFNFLPCHLECFFEDVIMEEKDSLINQYPYSLHLNKYLLPVFKNPADYVMMAERILQKYMPEQVNSRKPCIIIDLIENAGLTVVLGVFPDSNIMGEYFFNPGITTIYHPRTKETFEAVLKPGTIVVNRKLCDNLVQLFATSCHEFVHHALCFPYLMLQKMHGHDYISYLCRKNQFDNQELDPYALMEVQANTLPAYLFIQEIPGKECAEFLFRKYNDKRDLKTLEKVLEEFCDYFIVPQSMGKRRLIDFGYTEFSGFGQFVGGKPIPNYVSSLAKNESYTISEADGIKEYSRNPDFRHIINSGQFLYADGHYCLNTPEYICHDYYGVPHLTEYAKMHMSECCLVFYTTYTGNVQKLSNGKLLRVKGTSPKDIHYVLKDGSSPVTAEGKALQMKIKKRMEDERKLIESYNDMTKRLMKECHVTISLLAEETGLSEPTIKDMRNNPNKKIQMESIIAVCIALHLPPAVSAKYIQISPSKFEDSYSMQLYQYALHEWYECSVPVVNRKIVEAGGIPLTNLVDGFDENGMEIVI